METAMNRTASNLARKNPYQITCDNCGRTWGWDGVALCFGCYTPTDDPTELPETEALIIELPRLVAGGTEDL